MRNKAFPIILIVSLMAVQTLSVWVSPGLMAQVMKRMSPGELTRDADVILEGRLVDTKTRLQNQAVFTDIKVDVERVLNGMDQLKETGFQLTFAGGRHEGITTRGGAQPDVDPSERVLVFARHWKGPFYNISGFKMGKYTIREDEEGNRQLERDLSGITLQNESKERKQSLSYEQGMETIRRQLHLDELPEQPPPPSVNMNPSFRTESESEGDASETGLERENSPDREQGPRLNPGASGQRDGAALPEQPEESSSSNDSKQQSENGGIFEVIPFLLLTGVVLCLIAVVVLFVNQRQSS